MRFDKKVAVITGGGTGIGRAVAEALLQEGASVVLNGRREGVLAATAAAIDPSGTRVAISAGDVALPATARATMALATQRFGGVDILVNNAGIFVPKPFIDLGEADYDGYADTIAKGSFLMAQAAAIAMKTRGGGVMVMTGSMWAFQAVGATPSSAYSMAKAGVHQLVRNLAIELAGDNIRVNAVAPAVVETPVYEAFIPADQVKAALAAFNSFHPLGRIGQPADIVGAMLFLASGDAAWITGTILPVDGGVMAGRN
jgi:NAD(P)-dependent dehydrogenase (short-subunit alcohol dehydrogenase family)